ncbi:MAG: polysaccharide biosynthesis/export family protein, partial [Candidatus Acidiferrales bacterium]
MTGTIELQHHRDRALKLLAASIFAGAMILPAWAQTKPAPQNLPAVSTPAVPDHPQKFEPSAGTTGGQAAAPQTNDYRIGPEDLLDVAVFEAPELNCSPRVSASGEISIPLLGVVTA